MQFDRKYLKSHLHPFMFLQNVRSLSNGILFWLYGIVQLGPGYHVRHSRIYRHQCIRAKDIFHSQNRLKSLIEIFVSWIVQCNSWNCARATLIALDEMKYVLYLSKAAVLRHITRVQCFSALLIINSINIRSKSGTRRVSFWMYDYSSNELTPSRVKHSNDVFISYAFVSFSFHLLYYSI